MLALRVRWIAWVLPCVGIACSSRSGAPAPVGHVQPSERSDRVSEAANAPTSDSVNAKASLSFEVPTATGEPKTIHTAFVAAVVDGQPTRLIIDSGASDHVFTRPSLRFTDDELSDDDPGTDHAGASVRTWRLTRAAAVSISGFQPFEIGSAIVIDGPPPFADWGIGGFLSPQLLAEDGYVVVDLRHRTLSRSQELPTSCPGEMKLVALTSIVASGDEARLPIVEAIFAGVAIRLMLNTGGSAFEIDPEVYAGKRGHVEWTGKGVSGTAVEGAIGEAGELHLDHHSLTIDEPVIRPQGRTANAQIGMDYLRDSILWLPATQRDKVALCI